MTPKTRIALLAALSLGGAYFLAADAQTATERDAEIRLKRVEVATVEAASESRELRFSGVTRAKQRARLGFLVRGRVIDRPVEVGDTVRAGQVLARLDRRALDNAVANARGALAEIEARRSQAERDRERTAQLVEAKAATGEELERSSAGLDALRAAETAAQARLREAERQLGESVLEAPFAGTVTEVMAEPGEMVVPGGPILVLSGDGAVELEVEVPESVVGHLIVGDAATVDLPVLGARGVEGRVVSVGRAAVGTGSLFPVRVLLEDGDRSLVAGATAELVLRLTNEGALSVPVEAVVNPGGHRPVIFRVVQVAEGARVEKLPVTLGNLLGDRVTVHGDLDVGHEVVVGGQRGLLDGETVEVLR